MPTSSTPATRPCPTCGKQVPAQGAACANCGAPFTAPETQPAPLYSLFVVLGFTILVTTFFPIASYLLLLGSGGMYGPTFRLHSPALYYLVSIALNYGIVGTLIGVVLHKYALVKRVPMKYRSPVLFGLGCGLIVLTLAARVLAATVEGGGAGFVVANLSIFLVYPALIMLAVAAVKFFIGVGKGVGQPGN